MSVNLFPITFTTTFSLSIKRSLSRSKTFSISISIQSQFNLDSISIQSRFNLVQPKNSKSSTKRASSSAKNNLNQKTLNQKILHLNQKILHLNQNFLNLDHNIQDILIQWKIQQCYQGKFLLLLDIEKLFIHRTYINNNTCHNSISSGVCYEKRTKGFARVVEMLEIFKNILVESQLLKCNFSFSC